MKKTVFKSCLPAIIIFSLIISSAYSANKIKVEKDGSVLLPMQKNPALTKLIPAENSPKANLWKEFSKKNGEWNVMLDRSTNTPHRAIGNAIKLTGFDKITESNVEAACMAFLNENAGTFNINVSQLKFVRKDFVNKRWYVSYKQYFNGIEVLLSEVELRIFENGNVMAFGIDFFNNIDIGIKPTISYTEAKDYATTGIKGKAKADILQSAHEVYILPVKSKNSVSYRLVYKVNVLSSENVADFTTYVDAHNGEVAWRFNKIFKSSSSFDVKGGIKMKNPMDTLTIKNFPRQTVNIGVNTYTSDNNGTITADIPDSSDISANLNGTYGQVVCEGRDNAYYSGRYIKDKPFSLLWDDNNSHRYERNMYYHANYIHDFMKTLDPQLTCIDLPVTVILYFMPHPLYGDSPNAFSSEDTIMFLALEHTEYLMADGPSVLYHEYGHSINNLFFISKGRIDGMVNASCQEGIADATAALILDEPEVGLGVFANDPSLSIRTAQNNMIYPDSISPNDSHHNGQILSGAFWDLRNLTDLNTARRLMHFARYGLPDDPDEGTAFYKWFIETMVADDDDGNLANGTPHINNIIKAFNNHQIGTSLYYINNFQLTPLDDTKDTINPYVVSFSFGEKSTFSQLDSAVLVFQVLIPGKGVTSPVEVRAVLQPDGRTYQASIPAQKKGSEVTYYIKVYDKFSDKPLRLSSSQNSFVPYSFLVGFRTAYLDDFEKDRNWISGYPSDDATVGLWERGKPNLFDWKGYLADAPVKPANDYTNTGENCYITGLSVPDTSQDFTYNLLAQYFTDGTTTLTSPVFDITSLENVYIRYHVFFRQLLILNIGIKPPLITEISNNGGIDWVKVKTDTTDGQPYWNKVYFRFENYLPASSQCMVRFIFREMSFNLFGYTMPLSFGSAAIDDFEILTVNERILFLSVDDNKNGSYSAECYPNPFKEKTTINYYSESPGISRLRIFNLYGEEIINFENNYSNTGNNSFIWDGKDLSGNSVPSGFYFYTINSGDKVINGKIIKQ